MGKQKKCCEAGFFSFFSLCVCVCVCLFGSNEARWEVENPTTKPSSSVVLGAISTMGVKKKKEEEEEENLNITVKNKRETSKENEGEEESV